MSGKVNGVGASQLRWTRRPGDLCAASRGTGVISAGGEGNGDHAADHGVDRGCSSRVWREGGGPAGARRTRSYTTTPSPVASMEPTLTPGERVDVNLDAYSFGDDPQVGDIVLFQSARSSREWPLRRLPCVFIERIVAGPHDTLRIRNGHPVVNGTVAQEDFIRPCPRGRIVVQRSVGRAVHHPARPVLHDGRQPCEERRQPFLGAGPSELDPRSGRAVRGHPVLSW